MKNPYQLAKEKTQGVNNALNTVKQQMALGKLKENLQKLTVSRSEGLITAQFLGAGKFKQIIISGNEMDIVPIPRKELADLLTRVIIECQIQVEDEAKREMQRILKND